MFDLYVIEREALAIARLRCVLDSETAEKIIDFIEIKEMEIETGFDRFCDMTRMEGVNVSCADVCRFADRRSAFNPNDVHVKSAFLAIDPLSFGIARMYEQLMNSPRIEVRVWSDIQAAAEWLGVDIKTLLL